MTDKIPMGADKILFVEDFINFMMLRNPGTKYFLKETVQPYREFVYNAFNETIKVAVVLLDRTMELQLDDIFYPMLHANEVNEETFTNYAKNLAERSFPDGFDADKFLRFCVHLARLAEYFYYNGMLESPNLAFTHIYSVFKDYDMSTGAWDTLNRIAEQYASPDVDAVNLESPLTSDEEFSENYVDRNASGNEGNLDSSFSSGDENGF